MQRDFMNSLANRRVGNMQVTQTTTTSGGSSSSGGMTAGGSFVSGSINGGSTSSSGSTGAGGEWFVRDRTRRLCDKNRLPDACVAGNNSGDSGQPDNSTLAWPSREAQRRHYENLLELTIPLRNTTRWWIPETYEYNATLTFITYSVSLTSLTPVPKGYLYCSLK